MRGWWFSLWLAVVWEVFADWYRVEVGWISWLQSYSGLVLPLGWFTDWAHRSVPVTVVLIAYFLNWRRGIVLGGIYGASVFVNSVAKFAFGTPRPFWVSDVVYQWTGSGGFGLPSGHVLECASVWLGIAFLYPKRWVAGAAGLLVGLMGFSRVYLGVHFIVDVLAGLVFAFALAWGGTRSWMASKILRGLTFSQCARILGVIGILGVIASCTWILGQGREFPDAWPQNLGGVHMLAGAYYGLATLVGLVIGAGMSSGRFRVELGSGLGRRIGMFCYAMMACWLLREVVLFWPRSERGMGWYLWRAFWEYGVAAWVVVYLCPLLFRRLGSGGAAERGRGQPASSRGE